MLRQVNKLIRSRDIVKCLSRCNYSERGTSPGKVLHPLESRRLLKVLGDEAAPFLQGLITNDMRHFEEGSKSIYAMFLNNKGKVLYDSLIHRWEDNTFLIECDCKTIERIAKHLKLYKLKRNIKIEDVSTSYSLWALTAPKVATADLEIDPSRELNIYKDPRLTDLGYRVISAAPLKGSDVSTAIGSDVSLESNENQYRYLRYKLGVSEGSDDLPPGVSFPLEANCDYLHGVSFHKGCYIGQELTARIHHTGVVRKRIMPLKFIGLVNEDLAKESVISAPNNPKLSIGKLKGYISDHGIGLMRIKETLEAKALAIGDISIEAVKPSWWPKEAPKEKLKIKTESPQ